MKTKTKSALINRLPLVFCILIFIGEIAYMIFTGADPIKCLLLTVSGVLVNYVLAVIIHEAGHVIFAKSNGLKVEYVNFGLFSIDFASKKVKFFTFFGRAAGETKFSAEKKVTAKNIRNVASNGVIATAVFATLFITGGMFINQTWYYCFFCIGQLPALYLLFVNTFNSDRLYDCAIASEQNNFADVLAETLNIQREIKDGKIPEESELIMRDNQPIALYFHYLFTLIKGEKDTALKIFDNVKIKDLTDEEYDLIFPEIVYSACVRGDGDKINTLKTAAENFFSLSPENIGALRAHYAFRKFFGDEKWSEILRSSYTKALESQPPFIRLAEENLTR